MVEKGIRGLLRAENQPQVLSGIWRFRYQPFLDRGTVRRGGRGGVSILRFVSEPKNRLLHIFRLKAKANAEAAGGKSTQR
jgi:hypothetical protein